jgi:CMP-N-acetylneuraminic acid synthetase
MEENSYAYEMSNTYSVDIDNEIDLKIAEFIYKNYVS